MIEPAYQRLLSLLRKLGYTRWLHSERPLSEDLRELRWALRSLEASGETLSELRVGQLESTYGPVPLHGS